MNASDATASSAHPLVTFTVRSLLGLAELLPAGTASHCSRCWVRCNGRTDRLDGDVAGRSTEGRRPPVIVAVLHEARHDLWRALGGVLVITVGAAAAFPSCPPTAPAGVYL
jgi:hypothetical protein